MKDNFFFPKNTTTAVEKLLLFCIYGIFKTKEKTCFGYWIPTNMFIRFTKKRFEIITLNEASDYFF